MRRIITLAATLALMALQTSHAAPLVEARAGAFYVVGVLSQDADWRARLVNPPSDGPPFTTPETLDYGATAQLLVLFTGAQIVDGTVDLECDLTLSQPAQEVAQAGPLECSKGLPIGDPARLYPIALTVTLTNGPEDAPGPVNITVGVRDRRSDVRVEVALSVRRLPPE